MSEQRIIAHRGASHRLPENTLEAFAAGLDEGADGLELDVQLSRDGIPVVFHDEHLGKAGLRRKRVCDLDVSALQQLDVGGWFDSAHAGLRLPTLAQVLEQFAGRTALCVEIKWTEGKAQARHEALSRQVAQALAAVPRASILSFQPQALSIAKSVSADLHCVRNADSPRALSAVTQELDYLDGLDIGIRRFGLRHRDRLAATGLPLYAYTCDSRAHLRRALALSVDHIITNYPRRSREWLAELRAGS